MRSLVPDLPWFLGNQLILTQSMVNSKVTKSKLGQTWTARKNYVKSFLKETKKLIETASIGKETLPKNIGLVHVKVLAINIVFSSLHKFLLHIILNSNSLLKILNNSAIYIQIEKKASIGSVITPILKLFRIFLVIWYNHSSHLP